MWRLVSCCSYSYTPMESKTIFDFNYISVILLVFIFLTTISTTYSHGSSTNRNSGTEESSDYILCRLCGADISDAKHVINHLSPHALVITNQTYFGQKGVEIQILEDPLKISFQSITVSNSECAPVNNWQQELSWYPGYAWKPCICEQCRTLHGWLFEPKETANLSTKLPSEKGFFLLKLNNLISENFANSLVVVPKAYLN